MTQELTRRLATIRQIDDIEPIPNADAIEVAVVGGWKCVVKKGEFKPRDLCVYIEVDAFLQDGVPAWQFLVDKSSRTFNGVKGHKLRTIKLRGQISQGLVLSLLACPEASALVAISTDWDKVSLDQALGIVKWDPPLPAELSGKAKGLFPSFIRKTDQERCQNIVPQIFGYEDRLDELDITPEQADAGALERGRLCIIGGKVFAVREAQAKRDAQYEITIKMDGSSMTGYARTILSEFGPVVVSGVCSRNLELLIDEDNADNTFVRLFVESGLQVALETIVRENGLELAVQGELMGPGIQGNREGLTDFQLFVFDVLNISTGAYLTPSERYALMDRLVELGVSSKVKHTPILERAVTLQSLKIENVQDLLKYAEGSSLVNPVREGVVFKRLDGVFSFKAISNAYLAAEKD